MIQSITTKEHQQLYQKIDNFPLDDPSSLLPFSSRLACNNAWSSAYTQRVINEYKRFLFLCCISHKPATPSKAVDEAWHLHLTYTRSYWLDLCRETLGRDIHHDPSAGGPEQEKQFASYYQQTLALYEQVFGETPPADIWPQAGERTGFTPGKADKARNAKHKHWRPFSLALILLFASLFISATGISSAIFMGLIFVLLIGALLHKSQQANRQGGSGGCGGVSACTTDDGFHHHGSDSCDGGDSGGGDCGGSSCGGCGGGD